jgi:hypothetical protein
VLNILDEKNTISFREKQGKNKIVRLGIGQGAGLWGKEQD